MRFLKHEIKSFRLIQRANLPMKPIGSLNIFLVEFDRLAACAVLTSPLYSEIDLTDFQTVYILSPFDDFSLDPGIGSNHQLARFKQRI